MAGELTTAELVERIEAYIATAGTVRAAAERRGREVQEFWVGIAPVFMGGGKGVTFPTEMDGKLVDLGPGDYISSIKVESDKKGVRVASRTLIAELLEHGSEHNEAYACAAQTVEHFGGEDNKRTMNQKKSVGGIDILEV